MRNRADVMRIRSGESGDERVNLSEKTRQRKIRTIEAFSRCIT